MPRQVQAQESGVTVWWACWCRLKTTKPCAPTTPTACSTRWLLLHDLAAAAEWVRPGPLGNFSRDPDDDKFIHAALAAGAQWLVTGDSDLLTLGKVEDVVIMTPAQALRQLEGGKSR
jgi:predicted nucleic acid-binding protein